MADLILQELSFLGLDVVYLVPSKAAPLHIRAPAIASAVKAAYLKTAEHPSFSLISITFHSI